jgi:hypothetical protein
MNDALQPSSLARPTWGMVRRRLRLCCRRGARLRARVLAGLLGLWRAAAWLLGLPPAGLLLRQGGPEGDEVQQEGVTVFGSAQQQSRRQGADFGALAAAGEACCIIVRAAERLRRQVMRGSRERGSSAVKRSRGAQSVKGFGVMPWVHHNRQAGIWHLASVALSVPVRDASGI